MATASSTENDAGANPAANAIDQNFTTRWGSAWMVDPSWIYVDLGAKSFVSEVDISWEAACASAYEIDVSDDAATWTSVRTINTMPPTSESPTGWTTDGGTPAADSQKGLSATGRYVRINGTARCLPAYGYSIWEIQVLGDANASCTP